MLEMIKAKRFSGFCLAGDGVLFARVLPRAGDGAGDGAGGDGGAGERDALGLEQFLERGEVVDHLIDIPALLRSALPLGSRMALRRMAMSSQSSYTCTSSWVIIHFWIFIQSSRSSSVPLRMLEKLTPSRSLARL